MPSSSVRPSRLLPTVLPVAVLLLSTPHAVATPGEPAQQVLAATWQSDSLRDNRIGYHFDLAPVAGSATKYRGTFRFTYRDGRQAPATPIEMTIDGKRVTFVATRGSFDRSSGPLRGVLNTNRTKLTLTNCQARLSLVMSFDLDSDCVFRPVAKATAQSLSATPSGVIHARALRRSVASPALGRVGWYT